MPVPVPNILDREFDDRIRPLNRPPAQSYGELIQDSVNAVMGSIPRDAYYIKNNPAMQKAIREYMINGAEALDDYDRRMVERAMELGILPTDLDKKAYENIMQTPREKSELNQKVGAGLQYAEDVGRELVKAYDKATEFMKGDTKDPMKQLRDLSDITEDFLHWMGYEGDNRYRHPEDFINVGKREDWDKFLKAPLKDKIRYTFGTAAGALDAVFRGVLEFPTKGVIDIFEGGKPEEGKKETPGQKAFRILSNAGQILRPIDNLRVVLTPGSSFQDPERFQEALEEFGADPLMHTLYLKGGIEMGLKARAQVERIKAEDLAAEQEAALEEFKKEQTQKETQAAVETALAEERARYKQEEAARKGDITRSTPKATVPEVDIDAPQINAFLKSRRAQLKSDLAQLNPNLTPEQIDAMDRYQLIYQLTGGRVKIYPKFRRTRGGPVRAGWYEGAEAEYMLTEGQVGTRPKYAVKTGPRQQMPPFSEVGKGGKKQVYDAYLKEEPFESVVEGTAEPQEVINAVQEPSTKTVDAQKQAGDGAALGEAYPEGQKVAQTGKEKPPQIIKPESAPPPPAPVPIVNKTVEVKNEPAKVTEDLGDKVTVTDEIGNEQTVSKTELPKMDTAPLPESEGYKAGREVFIPIDELTTDVDRFQPREKTHATKTAQSVAKNMDTQGGLDPVVVWVDPKSGEKIVISGHSRFAGLKERGESEVPIRFYHGTESEAKIYAHGIANMGNTVLSLREQFKSYKTLKDSGVEPEKLQDIYGANRIPLFEALEYLSPAGKFLERIASDDLAATPRITKFAKWVGELRRDYGEKLTSYHENQIFEWLYQDKKHNYQMVKGDFLKVIETQLNDPLRTPEMPLKLGRDLLMGAEARADTGPIAAEVKRLKKEIADAQDMRDKAKTLEEVAAQEAIIDRNRKQVAELQGTIDEIIEGQGDIFAEYKPAETTKAPPEPETTTEPAAAGKIDTGFESMDAARNLAHQKSRVQVAEQALNQAIKTGDEGTIDKFRSDLAKEKDALADYQREYDQVVSVQREPDFLNNLKEKADAAKADLKKMAEESKSKLEFGGLSDAPRTIKNLKDIAIYKMAQGFVRFDHWLQEMGKEVGPGLRQTLGDVYRWARSQFTRYNAEFRARRRAWEEKFVTEVRFGRGKMAVARATAAEWRRQYKESELSDAGAIVEGIDNIIEGRPPEVTERTQKLAREYAKAQEEMRQGVNDYLKDLTDEEYIKFLEDYLPHLYYMDWKDNLFNPRAMRRAIRTRLLNSPNAKARKLPTLQDALDAGMKPITQDVATLHQYWANVNWQVAVNKHIANMVKNAVGEDGLPLSGTEARDWDWQRISHPALAKAFGKNLPPEFAVVKEPGGRAVRTYNSKAEAEGYISGRKVPEDYTVETRKRGVAYFNRDIWVSPELARIVRKHFEDPLGDRGFVLKTWDYLNSLAKSSWLALSFFHNITLSESGASVFGPDEFVRILMGRPRWKKGIDLIRQNPKILEHSVNSGLEIGVAASRDIGYQRMARLLRRIELASKNVPFFNKPTKWVRMLYDKQQSHLWENVHVGYKVYAFEQLTNRLKTDYIDNNISLDMQAKLSREIDQHVAQYLNDAFGGQEWESKMWISPKMEQWLRRIQLAPDWSLSNAKIAGRLISDITDPMTRRLAYKYWVNMAVAVGVATQAMNYAMTGHFTWENEYGHKLDMDMTPLIKSLKGLRAKGLNAMGLKDDYNPDEDYSRYYVRMGKQAREVLGWLSDPLLTAEHKASPMTRELFKQLAGRELGTSWDMEWTREDMNFWQSFLGPREKQFLKDFTPFSLSGNQFAFALPMSKGMTPYKGIEAYTKALESPKWYVFGEPVVKEEAIRAINDALILNGQDGKELFKVALGSARHRYYKAAFDALQDQDWDKFERAGQRLQDLGATWKEIKGSLNDRGATLQEIQEANIRWRHEKDLQRIGGYYENIIGYEKAFQQEAQQKIRELQNYYDTKSLDRGGQ